jgi:hypothetical protein
MTDDLAPPESHSLLSWLFMALGWRYSLLLPLAAVIGFVTVMLIVVRGRGPAMAGAVLLIAPLPLLVGIVGMAEGILSIQLVISGTGTDPKPSALAEGISMSFVSVWIGLFLSIPSYLVAAIGLAIRSLTCQPHSSGHAMPAQIVS